MSTHNGVFGASALMLAMTSLVGCVISPKDRGAAVGRQEVTTESASRPNFRVTLVTQKQSAEREDSQCSPGPMIERGEDSPVVDTAGRILGIPRRLLLWDKRVDNHQVSEETVQQVGDYLASRGLSDVRIRVNQYDPSGEWRRLRSNSEISPGWKYTVGLLKFAEYSLLPGRLFGGDEYNPFTNSLSLYSDSAALGLVESAYALDIHHRELPGTYAASQELPWIGLWHEVLATQEAMDYATHVGTSDPLFRDRHTLYARYGMIMGDALFGFGPANGISVGGVAGIAGAVGGHAAAAIQNQINRT